MVYTRPPQAEYPRVWRRFAGARAYRLQDLSEEMDEEAVALLLEHFVSDEPPCKHVGEHGRSLQMVYTQPPQAEYPRVWRRFAGARAYRLQDLSEEMDEEAVALLLEHFVSDEPPCKRVGEHGRSLQRVYLRPPQAEYPRVWRRFAGARAYRLQDLSEEMDEEAVALLLEHFVSDEPPCKRVGEHGRSLQMVYTRPPQAEYPRVWRRFAGARAYRLQDLSEEMDEEAVALLLEHFVSDEPPCKRVGEHGRSLQMVYTRPPQAEYPRVWRRFAGARAYRLQDLSEEMDEEAVALLLDHFVSDELPCKHVGLRNHPGALAELEKLWRTTLKDRLSLVCVEDQPGAPKIVGLNVLTVALKEDKDEPFETKDKVWAKLFGAVDLVTRSVDVFERFGVDKYLTAYGLVVDPRHRGQGIGEELLKCRIPLCKSLDIKVTATVFTAIASQVVAKKAGFVELSSIDYEEMAKKHGFVFPGIAESTISSKLMALTVE